MVVDITLQNILILQKQVFVFVSEHGLHQLLLRFQILNNIYRVLLYGCRFDNPKELGPTFVHIIFKDIRSFKPWITKASIFFNVFSILLSKFIPIISFEFVIKVSEWKWEWVEFCSIPPKRCLIITIPYINLLALLLIY